jgi:hypothetical protein
VYARARYLVGGEFRAAFFKRVLTMKTIEIEIDGKHNEAFHFRPLGRNIRGRFDLVRETEPLAMMKRGEYPLPIPSQRLGIDLDSGEGFIAEPLHDDENTAIRDAIEQRGFKLPPAREAFASVHAPTWLFWIRRAVESGLARIVKGSIPDDIGGDPQKSFITTRPEPKTDDRLVAAIERQNELMAALLAQLASKK